MEKLKEKKLKTDAAIRLSLNGAKTFKKLENYIKIMLKNDEGSYPYEDAADRLEQSLIHIEDITHILKIDFLENIENKKTPHRGIKIKKTIINAQSFINGTFIKPPKN